MGLQKWTQEQIDYVASFSNKGMSYNQIANAFNTKYDTNHSRNSIGSVMLRYGVDKGVEIRKPIKEDKSKGRLPRVELTKSLHDAGAYECRYSHEGGADMRVCGQPVLEGHRYCKQCCFIMYNGFSIEEDEE